MKNKKAKQGHALIIALVFIGLMMMSVAMVFHVSAQKAYTEEHRSNRMKANMIAEAGAHVVMANIRKDPSLINQPIEDMEINGGVCSVVITNTPGSTVSSTDDVLKKMLVSTGSYSGETGESALVFTYSVGTPRLVTPRTESIFTDSGLFCNNGRLLGISFVDLNGLDAHCNGELEILGGAIVKNGNWVTTCNAMNLEGLMRIHANTAAPEYNTPLFISASTFIDGTIQTRAVAHEDIDLDVDIFHDYAVGNGSMGQCCGGVFSGGTLTDSYIAGDELDDKGTLTIRGWQTIAPVGGVLWVEGNVVLEGGSRVEGCIIAAGNISMGGIMYQRNPNGIPSLVAINGDISLVGASRTKGLLFARNGDILTFGVCLVDGALIAPHGDVKFCGGQVIQCESCAPYGPHGECVMLPLIEEGQPGCPATLAAWIK